MPTTSLQDANFIKELISNTLLEDAIGWISTNLKPEEVFQEKELLEWASHYDPDEIYSIDEAPLESWADKNGYTKQ